MKILLVLSKSLACVYGGAVGVLKSVFDRWNCGCVS